MFALDFAKRRLQRHIILHAALPLGVARTLTNSLSSGFGSWLGFSRLQDATEQDRIYISGAFGLRRLQLHFVLRVYIYVLCL